MRVGEVRGACNMTSLIVSVRDGLEHIGVDRRIILKCVLKKLVVGVVWCGLDT
jgi:hypothetical protein